MSDTITDPTAEVLAAMLTENTGTHMLDSGGAYGRHWQTNQGLTVEALRERPWVTVETGNHYRWDSEARRGFPTGKTVVDYVTVDLFHFLSERCEYDADLDAQLHAFADLPEYERESWFTVRNEWLESIGAVGGIDFTGGPNIVNTYNGEDVLSQTIEYALFCLPDDRQTTYACLMIHGGCDVRGGYTAPRVFSLGEWGGYSLFDNARFSAVLKSPEGQMVVLDFDGGYAENVYVPNPDDEDALADIEFEFGETPIEPPAEGDTEFVIAEGPAKGWTLAFHEWPAG